MPPQVLPDGTIISENHNPPRDEDKQFPSEDEPIRKLAAGCKKLTNVYLVTVSRKRMLTLAPCFPSLEALQPHGWGVFYWNELRGALATGCSSFCELDVVGIPFEADQLQTLGELVGAHASKIQFNECWFGLEADAFVESISLVRYAASYAESLFPARNPQDFTTPSHPQHATEFQGATTA